MSFMFSRVFSNSDGKKGHPECIVSKEAAVNILGGEYASHLDFGPNGNSTARAAIRRMAPKVNCKEFLVVEDPAVIRKPMPEKCIVSFSDTAKSAYRDEFYPECKAILLRVPK